MKRRDVVIVLGMLLVTTGGCGKKDKVVGPDPPAPVSFPLRSTPQNALLYYGAAWEWRDSAMVDTVLADDYEGASTSHAGTLMFSKADELLIMKQLHEDPYVANVLVDLGPPGSWIRVRYASDPPELVALSLPRTSITIITVTTSLVANQATFMEFKFKPTTPAPVSPTDTLWSIVSWTETSQ